MCSLRISLGISWLICIVFIGIAAIFGWGTGWVKGLSSLYLGYGASLLGILIGAGWVFLDDFIGGVLIAWIYNRVNRH